MTDKISDFFKDIKERLASPFFSSFTIAWLIINWRVPVALFWYDRTDLEKIGYKSHFEFISGLYDGWHFIGAPLLSALVYCLLYPFLRYGIMIIHAWIRTWGTKQVFEVSKESPVSMERYLQQRQKSDELKAKLSELYKNESVYKNSVERLKAQVETLEREKRDVGERYNSWVNQQSIVLLSSKYLLTLTDNNGKKATRRVEITGQEFHLYHNEVLYQTFLCTEFYLNPERNSVAMKLEFKEGNLSIIQFLQMEDQTLRRFKGTMYFSHDLPLNISNISAEGLSLSSPINVQYVSELLLKT